MGLTTISERIHWELDLLRRAMSCRDADAIELCSGRINVMLDELGQAVRNSLLTRSELSAIRISISGCAAVLRRARLALQALQNLHGLLSPEATYRVGN
jgi:hypothetical protein